MTVQLERQEKQEVTMLQKVNSKKPRVLFPVNFLIRIGSGNKILWTCSACYTQDRTFTLQESDNVELYACSNQLLVLVPPELFAEASEKY